MSNKIKSLLGLFFFIFLSAIYTQHNAVDNTDLVINTSGITKAAISVKLISSLHKQASLR